LNEVFAEARDRGYLGDQSIDRQVDHAQGFAAVCAAALTADPPAHPSQLLDLGAGGGLPGLVLALSVPPLTERTVLLDGSVRRTEWLQYAIDTLDLSSTVEAVGDRAEIAGRSVSMRSQFSVVVSRSFGRPSVTAECAAPFLCVGGALVVSEPPSSYDVATKRTPDGSLAACSLGPSAELESRWPSDRVAELGFAPAVEWRANGFRYATLRLDSLCPERYPRRNGIPAKRPLF
jgi:16S rRNA (guanine527-N7)-methyltransferase